MQGEGRWWEPRGPPRSTVPAGRATWRTTRPTAIKVKKDFSQTPIPSPAKGGPGVSRRHPNRHLRHPATLLQAGSLPTTALVGFGSLKGGPGFLGDGQDTQNFFFFFCNLNCRIFSFRDRAPHRSGVRVGSTLSRFRACASASFLRGRSQAEQGSERSAVAERKGRCCHLAVSWGPRNSVQSHHRRDRLHPAQEKERLSSLPAPGRNEQSLAFSCIPIAGDWPWWARMEELPSERANLRSAKGARSAPDPASPPGNKARVSPPSWAWCCTPKLRASSLERIPKTHSS